MTSFRVVFSPASLESLRGIFDHLAWHASAEIADRVVMGLYDCALTLAHLPKRRPLEKNAAERNNETRFAMKWRYKIIYEIVEDQVVILDFFHTARDPGHIEDLFED